MFFLLSASYPQLFFPCVTNTDTSGKRIFGLECFHPDNRVRGLHHPVASTKHIDKVSVTKHIDKVGVTKHIENASVTKHVDKVMRVGYTPPTLTE